MSSVVVVVVVVADQIKTPGRPLISSAPGRTEGGGGDWGSLNDFHGRRERKKDRNGEKIARIFSLPMIS